MRIHVDGKDFQIKFRYDDYQVCTLAIIIWEQDGKMVQEEGIAYKGDKDVFNKYIGRKVALSRALHNAGFEKDFRTKVWKSLMDRGMKIVV